MEVGEEMKMSEVRQAVNRFREAAGMNPLPEPIGLRLRALREERGLSLRQFAKFSGVSAAFVSKVENELQPPPGEETIRRMAVVLDVDPWELLFAAGKVPEEVREWVLDMEPDEVRRMM